MKQLQDLLSVMDQEVNRQISPHDEMFLYALGQLPSEEAARTYYFDTGKEIATGLLRYLLSAGLDPQQLDFLDFAAGYGRVTRWLVSTYKTVTVADLDQAMIDFDKQEFGVRGFISTTNPRRLSSHRQGYDVVFVFSLFTHLPNTTWRPWLNALARLIRPGGHLIFSTHSYELFAQLDPAQFGNPETWSEEFLFWETNETGGRMKTPVYGCTIVKESYVRSAISELRGFELARHYRKGEFDRYHDVYVVRKNSIVAEIEKTNWIRSAISFVYK